MGASFDSQAFLKAFGEAKGFLNEAALPIIRGRAERIAERARALAPIGDASDPHAGRLVEDIDIKGEGIDAKGAYVEVGSTVDEAYLQEFGTIYQSPQPFMRPSIAEESK